MGAVRVAVVVSLALVNACSASSLPLGSYQNGSANLGLRSLLPQAPSLAAREHVAGSPSIGISAASLYVTNFTGNGGMGDLTVYHTKANEPSPIATITDGIASPTGDCVDAKGTLYVANEPESGLGWVSEYAAGQTEPFRTIMNGINTPAFCAVDGKGDLWVTNIAGSVAEYKKGATSPSMIITNGVPDPVGIAFDHSGNMYVSNGLGGGGPVINVVVYKPGGTSPSRTITDGVRSPVGIAVGAEGALYVTNIGQDNVKQYRAGESHPHQTITDNIHGPSAITIGENGRLYITNDGNPAIVEFPRGSTRASRREITKDLAAPEGSAFFPGTRSSMNLRPRQTFRAGRR